MWLLVTARTHIWYQRPMAQENREDSGDCGITITPACSAKPQAIMTNLPYQRISSCGFRHSCSIRLTCLEPEAKKAWSLYVTIMVTNMICIFGWAQRNVIVTYVDKKIHKYYNQQPDAHLDNKNIKNHNDISCIQDTTVHIAWLCCEQIVLLLSNPLSHPNVGADKYSAVTAWQSGRGRPCQSQLHP